MAVQTTKDWLCLDVIWWLLIHSYWSTIHQMLLQIADQLPGSDCEERKTGLLNWIKLVSEDTETPLNTYLEPEMQQITFQELVSMIKIKE